MIEVQSSCNDIYEEGLKPVDEALSIILSQITPIQTSQYLNIIEAVGRVLAEPMTAPFNVPQSNNSAVDGFALCSNDLPSQGTKGLKIQGTAYAGKPYLEKIALGQCVRIMTGAFLPKGLDTVVMQEHVIVEDNGIKIDNRHKAGQNIRLAGEDIKENEILLSEGKLLTPADIGLLASLGITEVKVRRRLRVAIVSTGDEIFDVGTQAINNGIFDSNRYILASALKHPFIEIINLGILEDNSDTLVKAFQQASEIADVIISSGGVSVGEADYTKTALKSLGEINFWKLAIKPGRPLAFGHLNNSLFFGLPGNPVAVMVTFYQFVLPALEKASAITDRPLIPIFKAKSLEKIRKRVGRTEIQRGILTQDDKGLWTVKTTGKQGSGILRSMSLANVFIILEHDRKTVEAGEWVNVQAFSSLF